MTILLVLIASLLVFLFGSLLFVMFAVSQARSGIAGKPQEADTPVPHLPFRWRYMVAPLVVLVFSAGMVFWFYGRLPEEVALRFSSDGAPLAYTSRGMLLLWAILPQVLLTVLAAGLAWAVSRFSSLARYARESGFNFDSLLIVMGNMIALPQLILAFAMLNTFGYNAYQTQILPVWGIVVGIAVAGAIALGVFFILTVRKVWVK